MYKGKGLAAHLPIAQELVPPPEPLPEHVAMSNTYQRCHFCKPCTQPRQIAQPASPVPSGSTATLPQ